MKRHFRDSWDVWREKVNAALGTVEQIDASEVLFDNDDTDLTADDVQEAIEEVNTKANTIALDISQLSASHVGFVAGETGMTAENVQEAIEEVLGNVKAFSAGAYTLNVTTIDTVEGEYAFTGSGSIGVCDVLQIGAKHLIKIDVRSLSITPTTLVGEVGGAVKFNNKTPLENINTLLNTEFTTLVALGGVYKFSDRTYADATKRITATIGIGQSSHYLQCYMPDGNETFVVPPISWLVWCS